MKIKEKRKLLKDYRTCSYKFRGMNVRKVYFVEEMVLSILKHLLLTEFCHLIFFSKFKELKNKERTLTEGCSSPGGSWCRKKTLRERDSFTSTLTLNFFIQ